MDSDKQIAKVRTFPGRNRTLTVYLYDDETARIAIEARNKHIEFDVNERERGRVAAFLRDGHDARA
jgi:hypothetical protein